MADTNWREKTIRLMKEQRMSQKDFAKASGITESSVSRYLNSDQEPRIDVLVNFAKALNVNVDYLLEGSGKRSSFKEISTAIARNGSNLTEEEKNDLIRMLLKEGKDG